MLVHTGKFIQKRPATYQNLFTITLIKMLTLSSSHRGEGVTHSVNGYTVNHIRPNCQIEFSKKERYVSWLSHPLYPWS